MDIRDVRQWEEKFQALDKKYSNQVCKIKDARDSKISRMERKRSKIDLHKQGFIIKQKLRTIQEAI